MTNFEKLDQLVKIAQHAVSDINYTPGEETDPEIFEQMLYDGFLDDLKGCKASKSTGETAQYQSIAQGLITIARDALIPSTLCEAERLFKDGIARAFSMIHARDTTAGVDIETFLTTVAAGDKEDPITGIASKLLTKLSASPQKNFAAVASHADTSHPLFGKTIVFTGTLQTQTRGEAESLAASFGAVASGSISKKTDYLVAGEKTGSKLDKAKALGVTVIDEAEWLRLSKKDSGPSV